MEAAAEGRGETSTRLLAVTVLTSFGPKDLDDLGHSISISDLVDLRVRKAVESGMDGVICSPLEASRVRQVGGAELLIVTPGVRSAGADKGDQMRVATPAEAVRNGANYLVIGRQVTRATDPRAAYAQVEAEVSAGV
jgi:orotidine-5'-phosphate decarboxylase